MAAASEHCWAEIRRDAERLLESGLVEANGDPLDPNTWLGESKSLARTFVYAPEVMESITIGIRTGSADLAKLDLSDEYLTNAGRVAQLRAIQAAVRLAGILKQSL